jgi:hypothetical protein
VTTGPSATCAHALFLDASPPSRCSESGQYAWSHMAGLSPTAKRELEVDQQSELVSLASWCESHESACFPSRFATRRETTHDCVFR